MVSRGGATTISTDPSGDQLRSKRMVATISEH
eukprot:CAMPEP_0118933094 /NCGR_PEP_ID=MMETSP1169-20130426/11273_1 /TAXON_ID=36882 /ORGANISM="Pyramimonas obovata, Strain CCMP722" /LENGTH=31 /DNA_ID= /DNA_START= /DNA_END= /DNA_ORIENTATION=